MSSSSRAARAASSRDSKKALTMLLFGRLYSGRGPSAHQMLDHSIYSYSELRAAYLQKLHEIHPDKSRTMVSSGERAKMNKEFVSLQEAWDRYESFAKNLKQVGKGERADASFTMFGVGCSFSDNDMERERRAEIMDQACRGWFSAGALSCESLNSVTTENLRENEVRLISDDMFIEIDEDDGETSKDGDSSAKPSW